MHTRAYPVRQRASFEFTDAAGTRVVVASRSAACLYDIGPASILTGAGRMTDAKGRLRDRDFSSDRPGRVFDRAPPAGRRGAGAHHATNGERSPHQHESLLFARRIVAALEHQRRQNRFRQLLVVAEPGFLGLLRQAMHPALRRMVVGQIPKDLANRPERAVQAQVARMLALRDRQ